MIVSLLILSKSTLFLSSRLSTYLSLKSHIPRDYPSPSYLSPSSSILSTDLSINPNPPSFPISQLISSQHPRIFANECRESFPKNSLRTYSHSLPPISKITANHFASLTQHSSSASKLCLSFLNLIPTLFLSCIGPRTWQDAIFVCSTSLNSSDFHRYKL